MHFLKLVNRKKNEIKSVFRGIVNKNEDIRLY